MTSTNVLITRRNSSPAFQKTVSCICIHMLFSFILFGIVRQGNSSVVQFSALFRKLSTSVLLPDYYRYNCVRGRIRHGFTALSGRRLSVCITLRMNNTLAGAL